jgi:putative ABC transport system ATP-binding protein
MPRRCWQAVWRWCLPCDMNRLETTTADNGRIVIHTSDITKEYQSGAETIRVLHQINLNVCQGEIVGIMGPSGSGKSTLLFILGLLLLPSKGVYMAAGQDVNELNRAQQAEFRRKKVGFVFQSCNLIETATVYENIEFPLIYAGVGRKERSGKIRDALERVNLGHRLHHPANRLSGGEQQRVAVARSLVNNPLIILADEPTGQLDSANGRLVLDYFEQFVADSQTAMVIVTHDPGVAARCTRVFILEDGVIRT